MAYHSSAVDLSPFSSTGLTDVDDMVPLVRFLVSDGWWITGQTILADGGYTTKQSRRAPGAARCVGSYARGRADQD